MYHVSAQGVDERMMNVCYYYDNHCYIMICGCCSFAIQFSLFFAFLLVCEYVVLWFIGDCMNLRMMLHGDGNILLSSK